MCKNKTELYEMSKEYKALLKQKAEIEARLKELKAELEPYVMEHGVPVSSNGTRVCYSRNYKITWIPCLRIDPDRDKLQKFLGDSYSLYTKSIEYTQIRVS